jgi:hypothetical protein
MAATTARASASARSITIEDANRRGRLFAVAGNRHGLAVGPGNKKSDPDRPVVSLVVAARTPELLRWWG